MGTVNFEDTLLDADGAGVTGSTGLGIIIRREADDYLYDFNDSSFKNTGWTTKRQSMVEVDSTELPGSYELSVTVTGWDDGEYVGYFDYDGSDAGLTQYRVPISLWVRSGVEAAAVAMRGTDSALLATNVNVAAGVVESNLKQINAVSQSMTDFKDLVDTGYDPAAHKIQGVVLTDTVTAATVTAMAANVLTASALATSAVTEIVTALLDATIDGTLDLQETLEILLALMIAKQCDKVGNVYTFKDQSGTTKVTVTYTASSITVVIAA